MLHEKSHNLALKLAKSEGFTSVEFLKEWQGYDLFVASSTETAFTGLSDYILVDANSARWAFSVVVASILFA